MSAKDKTKEQLVNECRESEERYRALFTQAADSIVLIDIDTGKIVEFNEKACETLGYTREEFKKLKIPDFEVIESADEVAGHIEKVVKDGSDIFETKHRTKKGEIRDILVSASSISIHGKKYIQGIWRDITNRKKTETDLINAKKKLQTLNRELRRANKKLEELVLIDSLTGLYSHRYLTDALDAQFDSAKRYASALSIIMIDIDYFKSINDVYGHRFGDLILKQLSKQLQGMVRKQDTVIRYGGEEFVIIAPRIDLAGATDLARRLLDALNLYNFGNKEYTVKLKLSIAVTSYPEDTAVRPMDLIELADNILEKSKEYGGNNVYSSLDLKRKKETPAETTKETETKLLKKKIDTLTKRANQNLIEAIFAFAKTIELKDHYTGDHVERSVHYATAIAEHLKLSKDEIGRVRKAAILHDLGKIGISEKTLLKKSSLNKKEMDEIKKHPQIAVDIIRPIQYLHDIIPLILGHHERWDGRGYPHGLKGEEIPMGARIVSVADAYQALTSRRPYRKAYTKEEAIEIIKEEAGTKYDPHIVDVFLKLLKYDKNGRGG